MAFVAFLRRLPVCCLNCKGNVEPPSRLETAECRTGHRKWEIEVNFIRLFSNILREVKVYDVIMSLCVQSVS